MRRTQVTIGSTKRKTKDEPSEQATDAGVSASASQPKFPDELSGSRSPEPKRVSKHPKQSKYIAGHTIDDIVTIFDQNSKGNKTVSFPPTYFYKTWLRH